MNIIERITAKLENYPVAKCEPGPDFIRVAPTSQNGFDVALTATNNNYTVRFNGWHENFNDRQEAVDCFAFGLSTQCRLKEYRRWNIAYKWTVEYKEADKWAEESTTGVFVYPYFGKLEIRYLQNGLDTESE